MLISHVIPSLGGAAMPRRSSTSFYIRKKNQCQTRRRTQPNTILASQQLLILCKVIIPCNKHDFNVNFFVT